MTTVANETTLSGTARAGLTQLDGVKFTRTATLQTNMFAQHASLNPRRKENKTQRRWRVSDTKKVRDGLLEDLRKLKERLDVKETEFDDIAAFNSFEQPTDPLGKADLQDCWFRGAKWQHAQIMNKLRGSSDTKTSDLDVDQTSAKVNIERNDSALDQTKPDTESFFGPITAHISQTYIPKSEYDALEAENTSLRDELACYYDAETAPNEHEASLACLRANEIRDKRDKV